jgi:hypothetical protein
MGMKSDERYDAKEAYNKKLSSQARMHYLENDIADRKGHSGTYSGNHPRYSSPAGMMGQAEADLAYDPMDDIAGQGTEGINTGMMKNTSPVPNHNQGYNDRENESLGMRTGAQRHFSQNLLDRRNESYGAWGNRNRGKINR